MKASGLGVGQIKQNINRTVEIIRGCGFTTPLAIKADKVELWLSDFRANGKSAATSNKYLGSIKKFTKWLLKHDRITQDPLTHLKNISEHKKQTRRALTDTEVESLLTTTLNEPKRLD